MSTAQTVVIVFSSVLGYGFVAGLTQALHTESLADEPVALIWPVALPYILALRFVNAFRKKNGLPRAVARDKSAP